MYENFVVTYVVSRADGCLVICKYVYSAGDVRLRYFCGQYVSGTQNGPI